MLILVTLLFYFAGIQKEDKQKLKMLLKHFIPDLFFTPRAELSDDELDNDDGMFVAIH